MAETEVPADRQTMDRLLRALSKAEAEAGVQLVILDGVVLKDGHVAAYGLLRGPDGASWETESK